MPFWKKSEDPWDVEPEQRRPAPDTPESRTQREYEDELRAYAEQANKREGEN